MQSNRFLLLLVTCISLSAYTSCATQTTYLGEKLPQSDAVLLKVKCGGLRVVSFDGMKMKTSFPDLFHDRLEVLPGPLNTLAGQ